ncbi:MAG: hypothetical protein WCF84_09295 [Anaerolineae bacterium]
MDTTNWQRTKRRGSKAFKTVPDCSASGARDSADNISVSIAIELRRENGEHMNLAMTEAEARDLQAQLSYRINQVNQMLNDPDVTEARIGSRGGWAELRSGLRTSK